MVDIKDLLGNIEGVVDDYHLLPTALGTIANGGEEKNARSAQAARFIAAMLEKKIKEYNKKIEHDMQMHQIQIAKHKNDHGH